ncbi:hypothetical protein [Paludisphaera soli]|uniref:hypothetical protein n=1 Tax=Paludisphaera soli TaxID=2712865 RepID=UPI0013EB2DF6|nr:hypothetical protein [Paludisphaera soli]
MAKWNLSTLLAAILGGWCCLWPVGWLCSWTTWWAWSVVSFFVATSLLFGRTFLRSECPKSNG